MKKFNKLVRDKIPDIIKSNNEVPEVRILEDNEFELELNNKIIEEAKEVINAQNKEEVLEELADLYEVMKFKARLYNLTTEDIKIASLNKNLKRGSFEDKIFLISTKGQDE